MIPSFTDLLKGAKLPEASHPVCLRADLTAEFEAAERELDRLRKQPGITDSLAGSPAGVLMRRIEEIQQEMTAATYTFRLRALPKSKWRALVAAYPPREDNKDDAQSGVNKDGFLDALIKVSVIDPVMTEEQWRELIGDNEDERRQLKAASMEDKIVDGALTDRQFSDLCDEAWFLNRGEVSVPFSRAASLLKRDTDSE